MNVSKQTELIIREFEMNDYGPLIKLWQDASLPYKPNGRDSREKMEAELKHGFGFILLAESEKKIIGAILGTHDGRKGWINRVAVHPDYRKQGIARKLVAEAEKRLEESGMEIITCLIEDWNEQSIEFFKRLGYNEQKDIIYFSKKKHDKV